jgi:CRISPR-associated endonuclease Cas1
MDGQSIAGMFADASADGTVIVDGYGVSLGVSHAHLLISDGVGRSRRERRIPRIPKTVDRILILASTGMITFDAQRWMSDAGIPWVQLDREQNIMALSGSGMADARLLRAQGRACRAGDLESVGLEITRLLVAAKIRGQLANIAEFFALPDTELQLKTRLAEAEAAPTYDALISAEGNAASAYWQAWSNRVFVPFAPEAMLRVPAHWDHFTQRPTRLTDYAVNRDATDPVNATLNYLYRIAEAECVHACHAVGLSPVLAANHADKHGRWSMALDLIEAVRPVCDAIALRVFETGLGLPCDAITGKPRYFDRAWVNETREGVTRLAPPYTHELAAHAADLGTAVRPFAYRVARLLADAATGIVQIPRPKGVPRQERIAVDHRMYPKNRLRMGVTAADLVPDSVWADIAPLIPSRPVTRGPVPVPPRDCVAAMAARYVLAVPWGQVPGERPGGTRIVWAPSGPS